MASPTFLIPFGSWATLFSVLPSAAYTAVYATCEERKPRPAGLLGGVASWFVPSAIAMLSVVHSFASLVPYGLVCRAMAAAMGDYGATNSYCCHPSNVPRPVNVMISLLSYSCATSPQELGLAVNVHSRSAGHHAITLLRDVGVTRAVLHAFDGKPK